MPRPVYSGRDSRDREIFLQRVFAFGAVRSAIMNLDKEDRMAGRRQGRGEKWLHDKGFERLAYGAAAGASLRQSLRSSLRQDGGELSAEKLRRYYRQLTTDIHQPWRGLILNEFAEVFADVTDESPIILEGEVVNDRPRIAAVWQMRPGTRWYITIDETGSVFGGPRATADPMTTGRLVAIVTNEHTHVEKLSPAFHACDVGHTKVVAALQALARSGAGALGIAATDKGSAESREGWQYLVAKLLNWVLVMLPLEDPSEPVSITIEIEERSQFMQGMNVELVQQQLLQLLERRWPDRSGTIRMQLAIVSKPRGRSLQPYADVVAYSWMTWARDGHTQSATAVANALIKAGAARGLLLASDELSRDGDTFSSILSGRFVNELRFLQALAIAREVGPCTPSAFLLQRAAETARNNDDARDELHTWVTNHINDASVDLASARRELDWFRAAGLAEELTPAERLIFATAQLDYDNLSGANESDDELVVSDLSERLAETHPILYVQAQLVLLSFLSNRRVFADGLQRALELVSMVEERRYSLLWRARAHSVAGQFHAFNEQWELAGRSFEQARAHIARYVALEPSGAHDELKIASLHALAVWDTPGQSPQTCRHTLDELLALAGTTVQDVVCSDDTELVYVQHACLRYAALLPDLETGAAIVRRAQDWAAGRDQHPWPFIRLYRTLLLHQHNHQSHATLQEIMGTTDIRGMTDHRRRSADAVAECLHALENPDPTSDFRRILQQSVPYSMH